MLGNPENERKCIFYLDTKPEVKKEAANQIRHKNVELITKMINWKEVYPKMKINQGIFCGEMQQYILEVWGRSEHITDATRLAQKICRSVLWE